MTKAQSRSMKDIVRDLCSFNPTLLSDAARLPHDCYMIFVSRVANHDILPMLIQTVGSTENFSTRGGATNSSFPMMETESVELFLEYVNLEQDINAEILVNDRKQHFVYEDHFNPFVKHDLKESVEVYKGRNLHPPPGPPHRP